MPVYLFSMDVYLTSFASFTRALAHGSDTSTGVKCDILSVRVELFKWDGSVVFAVD